MLRSSFAFVAIATALAGTADDSPNIDGGGMGT